MLGRARTSARTDQHRARRSAGKKYRDGSTYGERRRGVSAGNAIVPLTAAGGLGPAKGRKALSDLIKVSETAPQEMGGVSCERTRREDT